MDNHEHRWGTPRGMRDGSIRQFCLRQGCGGIRQLMPVMQFGAWKLVPRGQGS